MDLSEVTPTQFLFNWAPAMPETPQAMSYRGKCAGGGIRVEKDNGLNPLEFKYFNFANF